MATAGCESCPVGNICNPAGAISEQCGNITDHMWPGDTAEALCRQALLREVERTQMYAERHGDTASKGVTDLFTASAKLELALSTDTPLNEADGLFDASEEALVPLATDYSLSLENWVTARSLAVYLPYFRQRRKGNDLLTDGDVLQLRAGLAEASVFIDGLPCEWDGRSITKDNWYKREGHQARLAAAQLLIRAGFDYYPASLREYKYAAHIAKPALHTGYVLYPDRKIAVRAAIDKAPKDTPPETLAVLYHTMLQQASGTRSISPRGPFTHVLAQMRQAMLADAHGADVSSRAGKWLDSLTDQVGRLTTRHIGRLAAEQAAAGN